MSYPTQAVAVTAADGQLVILRIRLSDPRVGVDYWALANASGLSLQETLLRARAPEREIAKCEESWALHLPNLLPVKGWRFAHEAELPETRDYRDAWFDDGLSVTHDMTKARNIYRERVRFERAAPLAALDVEYQRADEAEDRATKLAVAARKQRLRDATQDPRIEACQTVEELSALDVLSETATRKERT